MPDETQPPSDAPVLSAVGVVAVAGTEPDKWADVKALLHAAADSLEVKLNQVATRDAIVNEFYTLVDALPLGPVATILKDLKPVVTKLAELGAK